MYEGGADGKTDSGYMYEKLVELGILVVHGNLDWIGSPRARVRELALPIMKECGRRDNTEIDIGDDRKVTISYIVNEASKYFC